MSLAGSMMSGICKLVNSDYKLSRKNERIQNTVDIQKENVHVYLYLIMKF